MEEMIVDTITNSTDEAIQEELLSEETQVSEAESSRGITLLIDDIASDSDTMSTESPTTAIAPYEEVGSVDKPRELTIIANEINQYQSQIVLSFIAVGKLLNEAKKQLSENKSWLEWLRVNVVDISEITAQRYMRLANAYPNPSPVTDLGFAKAIILLSLPENERELFLSETHWVDSIEKKGSDMTKRELEKAVRAHPKNTKGIQKPKKDLGILFPPAPKIYNRNAVDFDAMFNEINENFNSLRSNHDNLLKLITMMGNDPHKRAGQLSNMMRTILKATLFQLPVETEDSEDDNG